MNQSEWCVRFAATYVTGTKARPVISGIRAATQSEAIERGEARLRQRHSVLDVEVLSVERLEPTRP